MVITTVAMRPSRLQFVLEVLFFKEEVAGPSPVDSISSLIKTKR